MDTARGSFLRHPTFGVCRIQAEEKDKVFVLLESGEEKILPRSFVEKKCSSVSPADVDSTSALRDNLKPPTPLAMRVPPPTRGDPEDRSRPCEACTEPLNRSLSASNGNLKSCPNCSALNVEENQHVFHSFPIGFGTTQARVSDPKPDGRQSWCEACRGDNGPRKGRSCRDVPALGRG
jgi:hypothetical protein